MTAPAGLAPMVPMVHVTDAMVDATLAFDDPAIERCLEQAFVALRNGRAAMQARIRTEAGGVKLSTMGAVVVDQQVLGAKVYSTLAGQFSFVIVLFSALDGRPLATFEANAITRLRTAAGSLLAARRLAVARPRTMMVFGAGVQGQAHIRLLSRALDLQRVTVSDPFMAPGLLQRLTDELAIPVVAGDASQVADADIVVTASRSTTPLFSGDALRAGAFVAAIGSSLPTTRELDDRALARARAIVIEWSGQSLQEAGDLVLADPAVGLQGKLVELADLLAGPDPVRRSPDDILIYKAVGVGLQDIALAGLIWSRMQQATGQRAGQSAGQPPAQPAP